MKKYCLKASMFVIISAMVMLNTAKAENVKLKQNKIVLMIEAEDFQFSGGWLKVRDHLMVVNKKVPDAVTMINIPTTAKYYVWARAKDYAKNQQGTRRFTVTLDKIIFKIEAGKHGATGFAWEKLGEIKITAGKHWLGLRATGCYARCDAVLLTTSKLDFNTLKKSQMSSYRIKPIKMKIKQKDNRPKPAPSVAATAKAKNVKLKQDKIILMIEAEDFQFSGGWARTCDHLKVFNRKASDALTLINIPRTAKYSVWARAKDYAEDQQGKRRFTVTVDNIPFKLEAGKHGATGYAWEKLGEMEITAGQHLLGLRDTANFYGRCDAVLLTTSKLNFNTLKKSQMSIYRIKPIKIKTQRKNKQPKPAPNANSRKIASLENKNLRIHFRMSKDTAGKDLVIRDMELNIDGKWIKVPSFAANESLFMLYTPKTKVSFYHHPNWTGGKSTSLSTNPKIVVPHSSSDPFSAAPIQYLTARSARKDGDTVVVQYETESGLKCTGHWSIAQGAKDISFDLKITPDKNGFYSLGMMAFIAFDRDKVDFVQLPPLYQMQRLPSEPVMVTNSLTPHPLVIVQARPKGMKGKTISFTAVAEPSKLPFRWATWQNSNYGFSLLNTDNKVQTSIFSPVLGCEGSYWKAGKTKHVSWRLLAWSGDWKGALEYASEKIMGVKDYRKPISGSLTDAALNMFDLIMDSKASGWNPEFKGFYDIETPTMSKQAAPLVVLSAALLSRNEKFFKERALPTIEYILSRQKSHYISSNQNKQMSVPGQFYDAAVWQGVNALLDKRNKYLEKFIQVDGSISGFNSAPDWSVLMAQYRHRPSKKLLARIKKEADIFLAKTMYGRNTKPINFNSFYNISFYPYWWDLLALYDLTQDKKYLKAAEEGAFHTIAGLWSHPMYPKSNILIHPSGSEPTTHRIWWKNGKPFRLGWPRKKDDTPRHRVPAWKVSQIGLGLEQPCTYVFSGDKSMNNIMMSTWAPYLLRLYAATGREIYKTYARNSIIGRFANYPGYYYHLFTDVMQNPGFPYKGPDIANIYYHHIPVQLGFTLDYLVAQASQRSKNKVNFPFAVQKNYAWFTFRVYGAGKGNVFGDKSAVLWLQREIVKIRNKNIDWLAAQSPKQFHLMLMNQSPKATKLTLQINNKLTGIKPGAAYAVYQNGDSKPILKGKWPINKLNIPAMGMLTLSVAAKAHGKFTNTAILRQGHIKKKINAKWGDMHAFRLRSPFGSDSIFIVFTGNPGKGAIAEFTLNGKTSTDERMPYETSVYPVATNKNVECSVKMINADKTVHTLKFTLPQ